MSLRPAICQMVSHTVGVGIRLINIYKSYGLELYKHKRENKRDKLPLSGRKV